MKFTWFWFGRDQSNFVFPGGALLILSGSGLIDYTDVDDGRALSLGRIGSSSSAFQVLTVGGVCKVPSTFDYSVIIMGSETVAFLLGFH